MSRPLSTRVSVVALVIAVAFGTAVAIVIGSAASGSPAHRSVRLAAAQPAWPHLARWFATTTTTVPAPPPSPPTTQPAPPPTTAPARRPVVQPASVMDDAFWRRLANCESPNGANGGFNGYFQLAGSTAKAVGYHGGSYEEQLAAAKRWLAQIGIAKAGTRAGWPICWWVALRNG
jgi:hypothetical protein